MAATPDRTTIRAAIDELVSKLRTNLVASPTTATKPFANVEIGTDGVEASPRPFLTASLRRTRPVSVTDNDKIIEVAMTLHIVTDVTASDPHAAVLDKIGAVDDYLDSLIDTGVLDGAEGFDDRAWKLDYPHTTSGARVVTASAMQSFVVTVERNQNRVPAS